MVDDLIKRQYAIDAIENITWYHQNANKDMICGANSEEHQAWYKVEDVYKALNCIPSAQPEPTAGDCWGCNCPKMNTEPRITFETLQNACKYRRVYSIKGCEHKYVDCFYEGEVDECKKEKCPLMNQRDTEEL